MLQVALLRGVNLGKRKVIMSELRELVADAGFTGVRTLLASGNLVLDSKLTGAKLEASGVQRPTFEGQELADIIAYIVAAARDGGGGAERVVPGVPEQGQKIFAAKRCVACHSAAGKGGKVGPELARGHHVSLTQFAALMWNHAPGMWAQMEARGIQVPRLKGQEMADIVAFLYVSQ